MAPSLVFNPEARRARARLAAHRRWHPGDDLDELTRQCLAELNAADLDGAIDEMIDLAPRMTEVQKARIRRCANADLDGTLDELIAFASRLTPAQQERVRGLADALRAAENPAQGMAAAS
jgi:hypothetical protein